MAITDKLIITINSSTVLKPEHRTVYVDTATATGAVTVTLPPIGAGASQCSKMHYVDIIDIGQNALVNNIICVPNGTNKIATVSSYTISDNGGFLKLQSNGISNWINMGEYPVGIDFSKRSVQLLVLPSDNVIDGKTTGTTDLITIPPGKKAIFCGLDIGVKAVTGAVTGVATCKVQTDAGVDLSASVSLTGVNAVGKITEIPPFNAGSGAGRVIVGAAMTGTKIQLTITTGFTVGTSITLDSYIKGYFII